ncbi:MAG: 16S rRNA (adenine(1518)-N(6)/adenine(1519)-N(6))-dimethyltransferase RsmA [Betaproteobacteria bacterium]|nr:16S rRNA (adenine(1518)-N(6)/adenine(1519)-N(6))-dimethyltransferase RsmA [Betaproteobacteria bacterium]
MAELALHRARKRFGQNFLVEPAIVRRIVDCIDPQPDDRVIEIGPGLGALTGALLERVNRLDVVEIDRDLAARLEQGHARGKLAVHVGDALDYDFAAVGSDLRVVGNLPYNISSPLLFRLLEYTASIRDIHVMLQREVVDRMTAAAGSREYGRLTVMLGYRFAIERLFRVPSGAFRPQPKVESAFARLRPRAPLPWRASDEDIFRRVVAAAFSQRRKTLRNALAGIADEAQMRSVGIDPQARGETLAVAQYVALSNAIGQAR